MPSTYTPKLRLELQATGENRSTWGTNANQVFSRIEDAIAGLVSVPMADANVTLTAVNGSVDQSRNMSVTLTGANTAIRTVTIPSVSKLYFMSNATTGGFAVNVKTAAGSAVSIANGTTTILLCDGTNLARAFDNSVNYLNNQLASYYTNPANLVGTIPVAKVPHMTGADTDGFVRINNGLTTSSTLGSLRLDAAGVFSYAYNDVAKFGWDINGLLTSGTVPASRTSGFGTAALVNTGTSGATIPLLNANNTWSATQSLAADITFSTAGGERHINMAGNTYLFTSDASSGQFGFYHISLGSLGIYTNATGYWNYPSARIRVDGQTIVLNNGGTYSINVTGSAGSAAASTLATKASTLAQNGGNGTAMTFNWSGQGGQPSWLWGSNDGVSHQVYNPSNFSVSNAANLGGVPAGGWVQNNGATYGINISGNAGSTSTFGGQPSAYFAKNDGGTYSINITGNSVGADYLGGAYWTDYLKIANLADRLVQDIPYNAVGSYMMCRSSVSLTQGDITLGSNLVFTNASGAAASPSLTGNWICHGRVTGGAGAAAVSIFQRYL